MALLDLEGTRTIGPLLREHHPCSPAQAEYGCLENARVGTLPNALPNILKLVRIEDGLITSKLYVFVIVSKRIRRRWRLRAASSRLPMQDSLMVDDSVETSQNIISTDGSKLLVLIAEDEFLIQATLEDVMTEAGFEHISLPNADEAILALEEDSARFCALITDVRMPGKTDGWDLARRARELKPIMPVIYMTGDSAKGWAAQGVPNSVMLQKPFVHAQLVTGLTTLLNDAAKSGIRQ